MTDFLRAFAFDVFVVLLGTLLAACVVAVVSGPESISWTSIFIGGVVGRIIYIIYKGNNDES